MDRVETLIDKLKEQLSSQSGVDELLLTVQMLQAELIMVKSSQQDASDHSSVAVHVSSPFDFTDEHPASLKENEEKLFFELEVDESELNEEIDKIKKIAEVKNVLSTKSKPQLLFDPIEDIPTLTHQNIPAPEVNDSAEEEVVENSSETSINDIIGKRAAELSDTLKDTPVKDLKKAIGLNDRYIFISELFRGDEAMYERSIKTINGFAIYAEAEYWIKRELKLKLAWDEKSDWVKQFDQLVRRRFL